MAGDFVGDLGLRLCRLRWGRRVLGVGATDGVFARGFAPGVMGERGLGTEGVLFRRALMSGLEDEEG